MPILTIFTNVSKSKIPEDFLKVTTELVAEILQKPVQYVLVHINPDQVMSWGGESDPCGYAKLASIGMLGKSENMEISKRLYPHFEKTLGVSSKKFYIEFVDLKRQDVGYAGTTFAGL